MTENTHRRSVLIYGRVVGYFSPGESRAKTPNLPAAVSSHSSLACHAGFWRATRHFISNRYTPRLGIATTYSPQRRRHFLIATETPFSGLPHSRANRSANEISKRWDSAERCERPATGGRRNPHSTSGTVNFRVAESTINLFLSATYVPVPISGLSRGETRPFGHFRTIAWKLVVLVP